ncbi:CvpA family protein [Gemmobacter fulvus]|uniref:CvpA family protein n=1 Tax=Gemmobacter fulvus TaxID=2840474 RepID=A0A975P7W7_9RHOB|nr:CvpA family protein [Gemmobacter fulvus]MBT9245218.1 CvpA family protein [Gemmobacter fulvus]MDQ1848086.1 CvpA family protein [Gemmobacter fulvus]QWK90451.1 CvpA family protein [Gemmobacter fulvus]
MEGFTIIDGVVAAVIVLSAILAYSRGLVREGMAIAGWIGAAVLAYVFAAQAQPLVKELPVIGNFLGDSCELSVIAAFAAVFAIGLVLAALFTPLLSTWVNQSVLGGLDQALGFLFGVVRGVLLVAVAFIVYDRAVAADTVPMVDNSRSAKVFASFQGNIDETIPSDAPGWIVQKYEGLVSICTAPAAETPLQAPAPAN